MTFFAKSPRKLTSVFNLNWQGFFDKPSFRFIDEPPLTNYSDLMKGDGMLTNSLFTFLVT